MSFSNQTLHYGLPQYVGTDIPSILTDLNDAYEDIDEAIYAVASKQSTDEATVQALAGQVSTQGVEIAQNTTNLANEITARQNGDSALDTRLTTAENNITSAQGNISTITSRVGALETKVGSGTLDTVAQDLVGAVNELAGEISGTTVEVVRGTLTAGQTSVTLTTTTLTIGATSLISVFADGGLDYDSYSISGNAVTINFEAQASDVAVAIKVEN